MKTDKTVFSVGLHRPVYLWAGPGTVRMNQLKFMGAPNDIPVHVEAHTSIGAKRMAQEAGFNWAYLMYDWGFPPEIEAEDWEDFREAVPVYQSHGFKVFGYIQASNCVHAGSYMDKKWYAQTPKASRIHYYTGRFMTCWLHPEWQVHLREMISGVVKAGAEGVFFDNPWMGIQPLHIGGAWFGPAGCYCPQCRLTYRQTTGQNIPISINPLRNPSTQIYIDWRAGIVTQTMAELAGFARSLNPEILISANNYDAIMQPSYTSFGIDLQALSQIQDVIMIEDFSLPRWEKTTRKPSELVNNAITIRTARALVKDTPLTTDPYDKGIGFDDIYSPRRFQLGIAEAAACGSALVVKGTEYVNKDGVFTLLSADKYSRHHAALKELHLWLASHAEIYRNRSNLAQVGLLYPQDQLRTQWNQVAPLYFGVCQTLSFAGIPWKVITQSECCSRLKVLLVFESQDQRIKGPRVIHVQQVPGWSIPAPTILSRHPSIQRLLIGVLSWYYQAYFKYRWARSITDNLGITQWFLQSPHFRLPPENIRGALLNEIPAKIFPQVLWKDAPVLIEVWEKESDRQIHLVNYGFSPQKVEVVLAEEQVGTVTQFRQNDFQFQASQIEIELDLYAYITISP